METQDQHEPMTEEEQEMRTDIESAALAEEQQQREQDLIDYADIVAQQHEDDPDWDISTEGLNAAADLRVPPVSLQVEAQAVRFARAYREQKQQACQVAGAYLTEIKRLQDMAAEEERKAESRVLFLGQSLREYYYSTGAKRIVLPYVTLSERRGRSSIVVEDPEAFCKAHTGTDLVRVSETPDKKAISAAIKATGEIPDGADTATPEPQFVIKAT